MSKKLSVAVGKTNRDMEQLVVNIGDQNTKKFCRVHKKKFLIILEDFR